VDYLIQQTVHHKKRATNTIMTMLYFINSDPNDASINIVIEEALINIGVEIVRNSQIHIMKNNKYT